MVVKGKIFHVQEVIKRFTDKNTTASKQTPMTAHSSLALVSSNNPTAHASRDMSFDPTMMSCDSAVVSSGSTCETQTASRWKPKGTQMRLSSKRHFTEALREININVCSGYVHNNNN